MKTDTLLFLEKTSEAVPWLEKMHIPVAKIAGGYCLSCKMVSCEPYYVCVVAPCHINGKRKGRVSLMIPHGSVRLMAQPDKDKTMGFVMGE